MMLLFLFLLAVAWLNIAASFLSAAVSFLPMCSKGTGGVGLFIACVKSFAACNNLSVDELVGIEVLSGKKATFGGILIFLCF